MMESLIGMMAKLGTRVGLAEPAPAALYRAGTYYRKAPHGSKLSIRFFLGPRQAIGVVASGSQTLFWHIFDLPPGEETVAILAAYSTLWMIIRHCGITPPIDLVVVHGRSELTLTQDAGVFRERTGARLIRCPEPSYDVGAAAMGVALTNAPYDVDGHDLAREITPAMTVSDVFPWGEVGLHGVLLGAVSLFLMGTAAETEGRLKTTALELKASSWLKDQNQAKLATEKVAIEERQKTISTFRNSRVAWSTPLRTIAAAAPDDTVLMTLTGVAELDSSTKSSGGKPKKQLVMSFTTPLSEDGSVPPEIDGFLTTLREEPAIKRNFPLIEISGLQASPAKPGNLRVASYSVICLPKIEAAPKKPEPTKAAAKP